MDGVLGKFWNSLEQYGLANQALIVFTSDHGESLGEHGESTHGYFIYQSTLRVPLIIHWPQRSDTFVTRVEEPVSLLDLAPTVLQFLGVARPAEFQGRSLISLSAASTPGSAKTSAAFDVYSESVYSHCHFRTSALRSLRVGHYKYIEAPRAEFYDLLRDPNEKLNLYANQTSVAVTFRHRLEALHARYRSNRISGSRALSSESVERLSSLGYVASNGARVTSSDSGADPKDRIADYEKYGVALVLGSAGHLDGANAVLRQLIQKDPKLLDVRSSLGLNMQKLGRHSEAVREFKAVLKLDPFNVLAHFDLAVSENALGRRENAVKELEAVLALAPYYTRAEELLANIWLETKDYERARARLNHILTIDPANYIAHYNLGVLATFQENWREGERHLRAAIATDPVSAEAHNTLGSLLLRRRDFEQAVPEFEEAIRLNPRFAPAHYNLGMILRRQQRNEEADREFQKALAIDPQFQPARQALDRLKSGAGQDH